MAIIKNQAEREIDELHKVEARIRRSERREHIHRIIIAGLAVIAAVAVFTGHCCPKHKRIF